MKPSYHGKSLNGAHSFYAPLVVRVKNARLKTNSKSKLDFSLAL